MGYDLHITRKQNWADDSGPTISLGEWQQLVEQDPELSPYAEVGEADRGKVASWRDQEGALWWDNGEVFSKNADQALIVKMVALAASLGAAAQGDDGEVYRADGTCFQPDLPETPPLAAPPSGLWSSIRAWLCSRRLTRKPLGAVPRFKTGQRVRDPWGAVGTVLEVDRRANGGLGRVRVRFDDGREWCAAYVASGLELDHGAARGK